VNKKLTVHKFEKDGLEYTAYLYQGLVCPNPTEYYKRTRSYADMRAEYDLLNCHKLTEQEKAKLSNILYDTSQPIYWMFVLEIVVILSVLSLLFI
jgi:hypothetical protein